MRIQTLLDEFLNKANQEITTGNLKLKGIDMSI